MVKFKPKKQKLQIFNFVIILILVLITISCGNSDTYYNPTNNPFANKNEEVEVDFNKKDTIYVIEFCNYRLDTSYQSTNVELKDAKTKKKEIKTINKPVIDKVLTCKCYLNKDKNKFIIKDCNNVNVGNYIQLRLFE